MATNPHFNLYRNPNEQKLLDDLIIESIKMVGMDMMYLPRTRNGFDKLYYEDDQASFDRAFVIECYMKSVEGFMGLSDMTKFGYQVHDRFTFTMAKTRFAQEVTHVLPEMLRPREGDMLYFPMNRRLFEVTYVDNKPYFYQLGELQMYDLQCEVIRPSNQKFNTGVPEIDSIMKYSTDIYDYTVTDQNGDIVTDQDGNPVITDKMQENLDTFQPTIDNKTISDKLANTDFINFNEKNPFAENEEWK